MPPKPPTLCMLCRTSGEMRISNFMLWDLAYSELYFTDTLWPDFSASDLDAAIHAYSTRHRRFGVGPGDAVGSSSNGRVA
jgi:undecaprenyl diphosphate synthase